MSIVLANPITSQDSQHSGILLYRGEEFPAVTPIQMHAADVGRLETMFPDGKSGLHSAVGVFGNP
jgi:hypothetical protein